MGLCSSCTVTPGTAVYSEVAESISAAGVSAKVNSAGNAVVAAVRRRLNSVDDPPRNSPREDSSQQQVDLTVRAYGSNTSNTLNSGENTIRSRRNPTISHRISGGTSAERQIMMGNAILIKYPPRAVIDSEAWEGQMKCQENEYIRTLFADFVLNCDWSSLLLGALASDIARCGVGGNAFLDHTMRSTTGDVMFNDYILWGDDCPNPRNNVNSTAKENHPSTGGNTSNNARNQPPGFTNLPLALARSKDLIKKKMLRCTQLKIKDSLSGGIATDSTRSTMSRNSVSSTSSFALKTSTGTPMASPEMMFPFLGEHEWRVFSILILWPLFQIHNSELQTFLRCTTGIRDSFDLRGSRLSFSSHGDTTGQEDSPSTKKAIAALDANSETRCRRLIAAVQKVVEGMTEEWLLETLSTGQWNQEVVSAIEALPFSVSVSGVEPRKSTTVNGGTSRASGSSSRVSGNIGSGNSGVSSSHAICDLFGLDYCFPLIFVNRSFETLTSCSRTDVLGRSFTFLHQDCTELDQLVKMSSALQAQQSVKLLLTHSRPQDRTEWYDMLSLRPLANAKGEVRHILGIQYDLSKPTATLMELRMINEFVLFLAMALRRL